MALIYRLYATPPSGSKSGQRPDKTKKNGLPPRRLNIQESEIRFRAIAETANEAIITIDDSSTIHFVNPAAVLMFGFSQEQLLGSSLGILIPEYLRRRHLEGIKTYLETRKRRLDWSLFETVGRHKSGREFPIQISIGEYSVGSRHFFTGIIHDLTIRMKAKRRLETQYAVSRILSGVQSVAEAMPRILRVICEGIGCMAAELWLLKDGMLESSGSWRHPSLTGQYDEFANTVSRIHPGYGSIGQSFSNGRPLLLGDLKPEHLFQRSALIRELNAPSGLLIPISGPVGSAGVMVFLNAGLIDADPELVHMLEALGKQVGDLLERKRGEEERSTLLFKEQATRKAAQESERRLAFQADASMVLASSLDYAGTLPHVARLMVPRLADWCAIDVLDDNKVLQRVALVHSDPRKEAIVDELRRRYPPRINTTTGFFKAFRTGRSELISDISPAFLEAAAEDQRHLELLIQMGTHSAMVVPLRMRGVTLGLLLLVSGERERAFSSLDVSFAEDLARRIAMAVDSAYLYEKAQKAVAELRNKADEIERLNIDLERRVQERTAQLVAANKELEGFSYTVSHDLRAPLRSIHGFAKILAEEYSRSLDEEGKRLVHIIQTSTVTMGTLIDDLLRFSRIGRQQMSLTVIDMTGLAREVLEELQSREPARALTVNIHTLPPARGDLSMIRQALINLLSNAFKFTRNTDRAFIEVTGSEGQEQNTYVISDNGAGFDMQYADKLFGVFQRLHRDDEFEGTGVGLAFVQRIIYRHGGTIRAKAMKNGGATFIFTLPHHHDQEHDDNERAEHPEGG